MKIKVTLATGLTTFVIATSTFAQTSAEALLAMDNDSAAETLVREHSHGNLSAAEVKLALDSMSPAERKAYFNHSHGTRMTILSCLEGDSSDSAAESVAKNCLAKHE
ncbi:MAG: hypothetical protein AAGA08_13190 [Pseudomonadota bacterium]